MNKIFNKLFWVMAVYGLAMAACSDGTDWNPGAAADGQGVFFPSSQSNSMTMAETSGSFEVSVFRTVSSGAATAQITATPGENAAGIFTVPTEVSFADGATESKITVAYRNMERDVPYALTLTAVDSTPYGITNLTINVISPLVWEVVSTDATLVDNMFEAFGAVGVELTGITVEKHPDLDRYRFMSPYGNSYFGALFGIGGLLADDFVPPYIELDGETYPGGYYITVTKLGWRMINGVGPEADNDWGTFGSVYGNLSNNLPAYPLGSYNDAEKVFNLGALFFNIDNSGAELNYVLKATTLLYLNN